MTDILTYHRGTASIRIDVASVIDEIADRVLHDGNVDKALQDVFRLGTDEDMGLLDILDRLREDATDLRHELSGDRQHDDGDQSLDNTRRLEDLSSMREQLRQIESIDDLHNLDPELVDHTLNDQEREWIEKWSDMRGQLIESGLVIAQGRQLRLTVRAIRRIGSSLLRHMHLPPQQRGRGSHNIPVSGISGTSGDNVIPWEWGRPFDLDVTASLMFAIRSRDESGTLRLSPEDFVVKDRESGAAIATVLMLDMSRSMFDSGAWDIAKRASIALDALNATTHERDVLKIVGFSGSARELNVTDMPSLSWDQYSHGTNLQAGLQVAQSILKPYRTMNRQIVIVTDGDPTAYQDGHISVFENPVTERTITATLREARRVARSGIAITMITVGDDTAGFALTMTRTANGRLIHLPVDELGSFVVHDVARGTIRTIR